jgi:O-antigen/teichoic acid export membrane protein
MANRPETGARGRETDKRPVDYRPPSASGASGRPAAVRRETAEGHTTRLVRGGVLNLLGAAVFGVASFAYVIVITRSLSSANTGALFEAIALFVMLTTIGSLGTPVGLVRTIARAVAQGRVSEIRTTLLLGVVPVVAVSTLFAVAGFVFAAELAPLLARKANSEVAVRYIQVACLAVPFGAALMALLAATQGLATMVPTNAIDNLAQPMLRLALAVGLAAGVETVVYAPLTWVLPSVVGVALVLPWVRSLVAHAEHAETRTPAPARKRMAIGREFWGYTSFRSLASVVQVALIWLDVLLVGSLASAREAGIYAAASRYVIAGTLVNTAVSNVLAPEASSLFARARHAAVKEVYQRATRWLVLVSVPIYLLMAVYAPVMMRLFGARFEPGTTALVVLALAMAASMACGPVMVVLLMGGRSFWNVLDSAAALAVNVAGDIVLIPRYGITGAAIAFAVSIVVVNALPIVQVFRWWRVHPFGRSYGALLGSCIVSFGAVALCIRFAFGATPGTLAISCLAGVTLYGAILWVGRRQLDLGFEHLKFFTATSS